MNRSLGVAEQLRYQMIARMSVDRSLSLNRLQAY